MADNSQASAAVGVGDVFATDDISSVKYPRVKLIHGADGVNAGDVATGNPLPVAGVGTAGTAGGGVLTVQGIAAMTPLLTTEGSGTGIAASLAIMDDWDESDRAKVNLIVGQAGVAAGAGAVAATVQRMTLASDDPAVAALQILDNAIAGNEMQVDIVTMPAVTNAGTFAVQVDGAALTSLQLLDDTIFVDDAGFTPGTSKVLMVGFEADEASTDLVDEGDAGAARMTLDRKQIATIQPHTAGGLTIFRSLDLDETEEDVKTSAGQVYGWYLFNATTSIRYVKFYNATAANVVVGTTTPVLTIPVPAASSGGCGFISNSAMGIPFDTAISIAATTGLADNDTGAPGANDVVATVFYK